MINIKEKLEIIKKEKSQLELKINELMLDFETTQGVIITNKKRTINIAIDLNVFENQSAIINS